jgi:membrane protease subunit HflC
MRSGLLFALAVALLIGVIAVGGALFTVSQTEQAVVLRFGEPVPGRGLITEPGLHFKFPLVENVVTFDNRILDVESPNL